MPTQSAHIDRGPAGAKRGTARPKNQLLSALPEEDFNRIAPQLTTMPVRPRETLQESGARIQYVYFPNGGVFSLTTLLPDGTMVEAATVGDEGMFCVEAYLHPDAVSPAHGMMQVPGGDVTRLAFKEFRREIDARGALNDLVGRYAQVVVAQMMQTAACNALHNIQERCARWLLMTADRMHRQDFQLSHEFLAIMLGTRRPTVTTVARALQDAGLITYRHGHVTVLDRKGLEAAACQCYPLIRAQFERLRA
jgi:CRP-like cAMP-binding protein